MKKQFMLSVGVLALSMTLIFNSSVWAQAKSNPAPVVGTAATGIVPGQSNQKQLTRAQFAELSGEAQADVLANLNTYAISDLVNATPADLAHRQDNLFYIPAADFKNYSTERQWKVLKNPSQYIVVQDAASIPKIEISKAQYDAMSQDKKSLIRNSTDYIIIN